MAMDTETKIIYSYDELLDRLYSKLPMRKSSRAYDIPQLELEYIGEHVIIRNFGYVCERIRRDPRIVARFLLKELGAPGSVDEKNVLIIYKNIKAQSIVNQYNRFLETYVKCPTCKSYDTELRREGKIWYIRCLACGAIASIKPV